MRKWIILAVVCLLIAGAVVAGFWFWNSRNQNQPTEQYAFTKTYSGMRLSKGDDEAVPVTITLNGVRGEDPLFRGSVKIEMDGELLFYEDCCIYPDDLIQGGLFLCDTMPRESWGPMDHPVFRNYGEMMVSEDWSEIALFSLQEHLGAVNEYPLGGRRDLFVAPATTKEEALEIVRRLDDGGPYDGNSWE